MGRDDVRGKRKAKRVVESDEEEDDEPANNVEMDERDEEEAPSGKGKGKAPAKKPRGEDPARHSTGGGSNRRSSGAGPSGSGAARGGDDGGIAEAADVKLVELIKDARQRLEEAEDAMKNEVSEKDRAGLVRDVIRYMLFTVPRTKEAPVPKTELTSLVTKVSKERGLADVIIRTVQLRLLENFGFEMVEMVKRKKQQPAKKAIKAADTADKLEYVLRSTVPAKLRARAVDQPSSLPLRGLTMAVVSIISMSGGSISEEDLHHHLASLGVPKAAKDHPALGNVAGALEALCKQRYIMADKGEGDKNVYCLAEAAQDLGPDLINKYIGFYAQPGGGGEGDD